MSQSNPYQPSVLASPGHSEVRKVRVQPIELIKRAYDLIRDQYWVFLGITVGGIVIGSLVPFGIILGPMMVGIYLCYADRMRGDNVEFSHLFRGFDHFKESFIACLCLMALTLVVMVPIMIAMFALVVMPIANAAQQNGGNGPPPPPPILASFFSCIPSC